MKKAFILLLSLFLAVGLFAQDSKTKKDSGKEAAQKKKEERKVKIEKEYRQTDTLLNSRSFVLRAERLTNGKGVQVIVSELLNFISVDSDYAVIQIGSTQRAGSNGVGGITEEGRISNWKFSRDDKGKNFNLYLTVQTKFSTYDISMQVDYSGYTSASLTGIKAGRLTFTGNVKPWEESSIYKGQSH
jgi:hypothetical protein